MSIDPARIKYESVHGEHVEPSIGSGRTVLLLNKCRINKEVTNCDLLAKGMP